MRNLSVSRASCGARHQGNLSFHNSPERSIDSLQGGCNLGCRRGCKDAANDRDIEHALTNEARMCWFMARTSARDDDHFALAVAALPVQDYP